MKILVLPGDGIGPEITDATVMRGLVGSRAKLDYARVQADIDAGTASETLMLLKEVGELRVRREAERGGASLPMPEQEVEVAADGSYHLRLRPLRPAEDWNAQISLLTGMVAAEIMLEGGVGVLRTMPVPDDAAVARWRATLERLVAQGGLDQPIDRTGPDGEPVSLRRLVLDHVEEYGRHTGHADLLRECIDGRTGQ